MLNPWLLWGLTALAIPVVIHLIQRQRLQPRLLATLRFLEAGDVSNVFAPVPRDLLQLLLRLLLLLLFVLLMARLTASSAKPAPRALTIILDQSMSMQRKLADGKSVFEKHKADIGQLIDTMGEGDQFSLMLVGDEIAQQTGFLREPGKLRQALDSFQVTDGGGRMLAAGIQRAAQRMQSLNQLNACVLVFSDQQKLNYPLHNPGAPGLRSALAGGRVKLMLMDVPPATKPNIAVEAATFSPPRVYLGTSGKMTATVRNYSSEDQDVDVRFAEGTQTGENRTLALKAGEAARIDLTHFFDSPADAACSVAVGDDALPADNAAFAPMRLRDRRQILFVSPAEEERKEGVRASYRGADMLTYAINPGEALGLSSGTFITVRKVTPNLLERLSLPIYSSIVLYGLGELPPKSIKDLAAYVQNGGGLCIIADRNISATRFNESFAPLLCGLQLGGLKEPPEPVLIDANEASVTQGMLLPLLRGEWGQIDDVTFSAYFTLASRGSMQCVLRAGNEDWLAAVGRLGQGQVFMQTYSGQIEDTAMPRSTAFVPMVQEILAHLDTQKRGCGCRRDPYEPGLSHAACGTAAAHGGGKFRRAGPVSVRSVGERTGDCQGRGHAAGGELQGAACGEEGNAAALAGGESGAGGVRSDDAWR